MIVKVKSSGPFGSTLDGRPSSSKLNWVRPAGVAFAGLGIGKAHRGVGPSTTNSTGLSVDAVRSTATAGFDPVTRRAVRPACAAVTCLGTRASAALNSELWVLLPGPIVISARPSAGTHNFSHTA